ncbi:MAG: serine protease [Candidatus Binatia bacterium]
MQFIILLLLLWLVLPSPARASYLTGAEQLKAVGASFSWPEVRSRSLKIVVEYQQDGEWKQANLGSGFLISPEGLFVTAYHVMAYCLYNQKAHSRFSETVDCSKSNPRVRYKAQNGDHEYEIQILSHLREEDSTNGKKLHTPDEIIKHRDFVIGRLKAGPQTRFSHWQLRDFEHGKISLSNPRADFELKPLLPPKKVFIVGYPRAGEFEIAHGFLNLTDENHRGYFAADYKVYDARYLENAGIEPDTKWGIGVANHMSGGVVVDAFGHPVGVVVNGNQNTAGILSIENILETFFSRKRESESQPQVILAPTKTPLYLKRTPH